MPRMRSSSRSSHRYRTRCDAILLSDALLFGAGVAAAAENLDPILLLAVFIAVAILSDTAVYWIGNYPGPRVILRRFPEIVRQECIDSPHDFFERYDRFVVFVAHFVPSVGSFAPHLAGIGTLGAPGDFFSTP